ncbi:MAG TPA: hypothetical protein VJN18_28445, partial [Polyangiaceae bacterium]|nr:hypothetical protein [Polyangiaceae bacterium]
MAIAVIGGVISSTLLSLIVVPVVYLSVEDARKRLARTWQRWQRKPRSKAVRHVSDVPAAPPADAIV